MRDVKVLERWGLILRPAIRTHPRRLEWPDVWRSPDGWVVEIFGLWQLDIVCCFRPGETADDFWRWQDRHLGIRRSDDGA